MTTSKPLSLCLLALASLAGADENRIPPAFRSAFEARVQRGAYAVVVQRGVPTTSIYGVDGRQQDAHFSVDVKGGAWVSSEGFFDFNQIAADALAMGEVLEVAKVSFKDKDNRIDLRLVSVEAHKVTRGQGFAQSTRREPVATNFKFFVPFGLDSPRAVEPALRYVEEYLKVFRSEDQARAYAAQLLAGRAPRARADARAGNEASASGSRPARAGRQEIKPGMTALEVLEILGRPQKEVAFQSQSKWTYADLTVIFEAGRVKEVRF